MYFKTKSGHLKDPETLSLIYALTRFSNDSWDEKGRNIHGAEDSLIEGWAQGLVVFLNDEEWQALMKQLATEKEKANQYVS